MPSEHSEDPGVYETRACGPNYLITMMSHTAFEDIIILAAQRLIVHYIWFDFEAHKLCISLQRGRGVPVGPDRPCWGQCERYLKLYAVKLFSKYSNRCEKHTWTSRTDRRTDSTMA